LYSVRKFVLRVIFRLLNLTSEFKHRRGRRLGEPPSGRRYRGCACKRFGNNSSPVGSEARLEAGHCTEHSVTLGVRHQHHDSCTSLRHALGDRRTKVQRSGRNNHFVVVAVVSAEQVN
jgi:hypothetical protein